MSAMKCCSNKVFLHHDNNEYDVSNEGWEKQMEAIAEQISRFQSIAELRKVSEFSKFTSFQIVVNFNLIEQKAEFIT